MKDLFVSATKNEILPFLKEIGVKENLTEGSLTDCGKFDLLISGVGLLSTSYHLATVLAKNKYSLIFNFGIAGSFSDSNPIKTAVLINQEILSDFGAETHETGFLDIFEMELLAKDEFPFTKGMLHMDMSPFSKLTEGLPLAKSITVNRVLSHENSIKWVRERFAPDVVNMEGAALFYAAIKNAIPCIQIRSISDYVGKRDKTSWDIAGAIEVLNNEIRKIYGRRYNIS